MKSSNTPFPRRRGANQRERRLVQTRACRAPWIYRIVNDAAEQCHRSAPYLQLTPLRVEATYRCCDHGKALGCELSRIPVSDTLRRVICKAVQSARQIQGSQHASSRRRSINVVIRRMLVRLMRPQLSTSFVHLSTGRHTTGGVIVAAVTVSEPVETAIMPRRRARTTTFAPGSLGSVNRRAKGIQDRRPIGTHPSPSSMRYGRGQCCEAGRASVAALASPPV